MLSLTLPQNISELINQYSSLSSAINKQKIVICGGGNAAHVFCALCSLNIQNDVHLVSLYENESNKFKSQLLKTSNKSLIVDIKTANFKNKIKSKPFNITDNPQCLENADIIILALPSFAHSQYLYAIKEHNIKSNSICNKKPLVALFPGGAGLECEWYNIIGKDSNFILLSGISLPWACRIIKYGQSVDIHGIKKEIKVCVAGTTRLKKQFYINKLQEIIGIDTILKDNGHILNMSISNPNPMIHPAIMYSKWHKWNGIPFTKPPLFYHGIDEKCGHLLYDINYEIINIAKNIELETSIKLNVPMISQWLFSVYGDDFCKEDKESKNIFKILSTSSVHPNSVHPMIKTKNNEYIPNYNHRYLTEDIPSLVTIRGLSLILTKNKCNTPSIDKLIKWAQKILNKEYFVYAKDGTIKPGKDLNQTRAPQRYGIKNIQHICDPITSAYSFCDHSYF